MSNTNFPFTKNEALDTSGGSLPAGIDQEEYEGILDTLATDGPEGLEPGERDTLKQVIEHQKSVSSNSPQPTQEASSDLQPGEKTGKNEKGFLRLLEASTGKPGNRINALVPSPNLEEQIEEVRKLLAEGKEIPSGWTLTEAGEPIPPGHRINAAGWLMPVMSRKQYEEEIANLKKELEYAEKHLERDKLIPGKTGSDLVAKHKSKIRELKSRLKDTDRMLGDAIANEPLDVGSFKVYHSDGKYFVPSSKGGWYRTNESAAKQYLQKHHGILSRKLRDGDPLTQIDDVMVSIRDRHSVFWAGGCGGSPPQVMTVNGKDILILDGPKIITPVKGEFPIIKSILLGLLGEEQLEYFNGWMKWGLENLIKAYQGKESRPGQFVCLVGPRGCGKNLLQERIITAVFGGRVAKPTAFFNEKTIFNADLAGAEHWLLADEVPARDIDSRRAFGNYMKGVASNAEVRAEVKFFTPVVLRPFRRGTVSLNNEDENIRTLPPLDESIEEKLMLFSCSFVNLPLPSGEKIETAIANELPAYAYYLQYEHEIRSELRDERFGVIVYHHPGVLEALSDTTPERQLLQVIDRYSDYIPYKQMPDGAWVWKGKLATDTQEALEAIAEDKSHSARMRLGALLKHPNSCGTYLSRLAKQLPGRVTKRRPDNAYVYDIVAPAGWKPKDNTISFVKAAA